MNPSPFASTLFIEAFSFSTRPFQRAPFFPETRKPQESF
jgi:hypothetical protein